MRAAPRGHGFGAGWPPWKSAGLGSPFTQLMSQAESTVMNSSAPCFGVVQASWCMRAGMKLKPPAVSAARFPSHKDNPYQPGTAPGYLINAPTVKIGLRKPITKESGK